MSRRGIVGVAVLLGCAGVLPHATQASPGAVETVAFLPWDGVAGRLHGLEAESFGPQSFAIQPDGGVLVLDQVNLRVIELTPNGDHIRDIPLQAATFDDVEQFHGEAVLLLDRLKAKALLVLDRHGTPVAEIDLEGRGIVRGGYVTAMLPRADGVWLEVNNRYSVKVLNRDLLPCERQIVLGRPLERNRSLHGALNGAGGVRLWTNQRNGRSTPTPVTISGTDPVRRIVWMDEDPGGYIHVALHEIRYAATTPFGKLAERTSLVVLDHRLAEVARRESPWVLTYYTQRVEVRVGPAGRVWQMAFDDNGVHLLRWDWRAP